MVKFLLPLLLLAPNIFAASIDPHVTWRTLKTPHFEIFFDEKQRELAQYYGVAAEQAYEILKHRFSELPGNTYLVIRDNTDFSNGFSTFLPYPMIEVYPVLPSSTITLDYYDNWPLGLLTHEYTHSLTFEPIHGFIKTFYYIFGTIVQPNGLLPRWYLEGLAVESESRFSSVGRLKSPRTFAELRALTEDNRLERETIDRINESLLPEYPFGERPYLFGSILWEHMMQKGPPDIVDRLNQRYGRRVPFFIQPPVEDIFHLDYQGLLAETYNEVETKARAQIAEIQKVSKESNRPFRDINMETFAPSLSPDGRTLVFIATAFNRAQIRMIQRGGQESFAGLESKKLYDISGTTRMEWLPDNQTFVFDAIDDMDPYHVYHALYEYDVPHRRATKITNGIRAQDPGVSPSGRRVAFVINDGGRQRLAVLDRYSGDWRLLMAGEISVRISTPEFIDENEIAYTKRTLKGEEHLYLLNLADNSTKEFFTGEKELRRPKVTKMGLLLATTGSGVENIALADLAKGKLKPLTNTTTEIQTVEWDSHAKELIATRETGRGRRLVATNPLPDSVSELPKIGSTVPGVWPTPTEPPAIQTSNFEESGYNSAKYLLPRYWIPFIYPVFNGVYVQGTTSMSDPVGKNTYTAAVDYDTLTAHGGFAFQYINSSFTPDIELDYIKSEEWLGVLGVTQQDETMIGDLAFYLPGMGPHFKGMVGFMHDHAQTPFNGLLTRQGPIASLTFSNWDDPRVEGAGTFLQLAQSQFVSGINESGDVRYGRTFIEAAQAWRRGLPNSHRIVATVKAAFEPDLPFNNILSFGDSNLGANYLVSLSTAQFLFRGYDNGTFVGRKVLNWNLEYQFPLSKDYHGWGTFPLFSRGWDGLVFFDGLSVEGAAFNPDLMAYYRRGLGDYALSTGFEAHWNTTMGYQLPVTAIFGAYFGFDSQAKDSMMPFIGLALSDMSALNNLKKNWIRRSTANN